MTMQTTPRNFGTSARLQPFGESVFATISRLAAQHGAVNLGQGFPNFDGPQFVKDAGMRAIKDGFGQYARTFGVPELNAAVAARFRATPPRGWPTNQGDFDQQPAQSGWSSADALRTGGDRRGGTGRRLLGVL